MRIRGATTDLEAAGLDTDGMAESTAKLREEVLALSGVDIMLDNDTFKGTYQILDELSEKWADLTDIQQASLTELIAGKRQGNIVSALMSNFDIARETLDTAMNKSAGSAERELSNYQKGIEYSLDRFTAQFQELSTTTLSSDLFKGMVDGGTNALSVVTALIDKIGLIPMLLGGIMQGSEIGFNYDTKNGFSFVNPLKAAIPEITEDVKKLFNSFDSKSNFFNQIENLYNTADFKTSPFGAWVDSLSETERATLSAGDALKKYKADMTAVGQTTSVATKALSGLKNIGMSALSMFGNMAMVFAVTKGIELLVTAIDNYVHRSEIAIEKGEEARTSISETIDEFSITQQTLDNLGNSFKESGDTISTTGDAIDSVAKKYAELSQGVNKLTNENKSLSAEGYENYLDISNQLAEQFPSLVSGYDSQGNAILNLGNNAESAALSLRNLYEAQMLSANVEIGENLQTAYAGYAEEIKQYEKDNKSIREQIEQIDSTLSKAGKSGSAFDISYGEITLDSNILGDNWKDARKEIYDTLDEMGVAFQEVFDETGTLHFSVGELSDKQMSEVKKKLSAYSSEAVDSLSIDKNELLQQEAANKLLMQDSWNNMADSLSSYLKTSKAFTDLDSDLQNAFLGNITKIDPSIIASDYDGDIKEFMYRGILQPLSELEPEAQKKLSDLLTLDTSNMSLNQYKTAISNIIKNAFPNDSEIQDRMKTAFGLDGIIEENEKQLEVLKEKFGNVADDLSLSELDEAYDLVVNDGFSGTFDELEQEIERAKALAATEIDLKANTHFDAISAADSTANAGDDYVKAKAYLDEAKEMLDNGLIGTDDFKTRAAYFSATGAEDAVNFAENYAKAARYLTEDSSGVINFLNDLTTKTNESGSALASFDDATGAWKYNIEDLESAAQQMGIGFEFFMDMFGRLEDYGFSNNFVGSVEDGANRIAEKSKELAAAKAELARLESEGADNTAIEQQRNLINQLKTDIDETQNSLDTLLSKSADDYAQQIESASNTINTLAEERKKILEDNAYGKNTQAVADAMEEEIRGLASENHLELDADLRIANKEDIANELSESNLEISVQAGDFEDVIAKGQEALSSVQELVGDTITLDLSTVDIDNIESQVSAVKNALSGLAEEDGTVNVNTEGVSECLSMLDALYAKKNELSSGIIMHVDTSSLSGDVASAISLLQEFQSAYAQLEQLQTLQAAGLDVDTSAAESKIQSLAGQIANFDGDTMAQLGLDTSQFDSALSAVQAGNYNVKIGVNVDDTALSTIQSSIAAINPNTIVTVTGQAIGEADINSLSASIGKVNNKSVKVSASASGQSAVESLAASIRSVTSKTVYVTTIERTQKESKASGTMLSPARASGTAYNVINHKPAFSNGSVALSKDEEALVNELGTESLIRDGVWSLIPGGMHTQSLKRGDIILSAAQTKSLLENGRALGQGKAYASGSGGGKFFFGNNNTPSYSSTVSAQASTQAVNQATQAATQATQSAATAASATEDALDAITDYFDWIQIRYDRLARETEISENAIDTAVGLSSKQANTAETIRKVQNEINAAQQGADRYLSHANWFAGQSGLSGDLVNRIQNGTIDINKYDEDTQKKIKEYQEYYENYLDSLDKVTELQEKELELAQKRLSNIEDFYDLVITLSESIQKSNDALLEFEEAKGFSSVSDSVRSVYENSMAEAQKVYDNSVQQLTDYQSEFNNLVSSGYLKEGSDAWYEAKAQMYEFEEAVSEAGTSLVEFEDKIREIEYTKIQNLIDGFERAVDKIDAKISLMESRDESVPESLYQKQLNSNNAQIQANYSLRQKKLSEQAFYDVNSTRYQELAEEINKLDTDTLGLMEDNEKLKDSIFELRFDPLDEALDKYQSLRNEISKFQDLLNDDAFFDKKGGITADGIANIALIQQQMAVAKQEIADYRTGLEKLQKSLDNGVISQKEYNEKSEEYRNGLQDAVADVKDYQDALTDLYMIQLQTEVDALNEIIDKRKEALRQKAEYYDYDKKLKSQTKDVDMLRAQIQALSGVNNATAAAERKRLEQQLKEAEEELSDTKRDHALDMQEEGYDGLSADMEQMLEDTEYEIAHSAEKQESIINSMLNRVVTNYKDAFNKINSIIGNTGWIGSSDFNRNQNNLGTATGAQTQNQSATQKPTNTKPSGTASGTVTNPIKDNTSVNSNIETEIMKDPNTTNRPVAELKLSKSNVTIQEGQSTTVTASIRPTDAKNKTLSWKTSNAKVATVSNGTIKAVAPGACQVTASTTDGSGISVTIGVTVTKKPDPPKPTPPVQEQQQSGGDGIPRVGDVVTLKGGQYYYYDSWGARPAGNRYSGVRGGVVIDGYSASKYGGAARMTGGYDVHIKSADGRYGDLGWVRLDQIEGYAKGTSIGGVNKDKYAWTQENGSELIYRKSDGAMLTSLGKGDVVYNNQMTRNLMRWGSIDPQQVLGNSEALGNGSGGSKEIVINSTYDSLLTVNGNVDKDALPELKELLEQSYQYTSDKLYKDARKLGYRKK